AGFNKLSSVVCRLWSVVAGLSSVVRGLYQHSQWLFQQGFQRLQECGTSCSIYHAMITTHRHFHHISYFDLSILNNGNLLNSPYRKYARIRRINDGSELVDSKHAKVGNGKSISFPVLRLKFLVLCFLCEVFYFHCYLRKRF